MNPTRILSIALCLGFALPACDSGDDEAAKALLAAAEAKKKAEEEAMAKRKAEREAKQAAEKQAEEEKKALVASVAVLPEKLPKKLDAACEDASKAQDEFMLKFHMTTPEKKAKWDEAKATQLGMAKKTCMGTNIEVAACQANAMRNASEQISKELPAILRTCIEKFSGDSAEGQVAAK